MEPYLQLLQHEMQLGKQNNDMKRHEAWQVYGALLVGFSICHHSLEKRLNLVIPKTNISGYITASSWSMYL